MATPPNIEKKLDRYYDDLIGKILELIEKESLILGEHKDLKKEVSKLREVILQTQIDIQSIILKIKPLPISQVTDPQSLTNNSLAINSNANNTNSSINGTNQTIVNNTNNNQPTNAINNNVQSNTNEEPNKTEKTTNRSLKDYLAAEISIFDVKVLNAFIKGTKEIIKANCRKEPNFLKPRVEKNMKIAITVAGRMHLSRESGSGIMAVAFDNHSIQAVAKDLMMMPLT